MVIDSIAPRAATGALILLLCVPALAQSPTRARLVTASPSPIGQPVTMTAEVDALGGAAPRGVVSFSDGAATLGAAPLIVAGAGQATLAVGFTHTCALTSSGGVKCWGYNNVGQLGDGTRIQRETPVSVRGLTAGVIAIAAGGYNTCALTKLGAARCWGLNDLGQLGDGTRTNRSTPAAVAGLSSGVVAIGAGASHACALTAAGRVLCWGSNRWGELGNGGSVSSETPIPIDDPGTVYRALAVGGGHTCGLTIAGALKCWGYAKYGQIGSGYPPVRTPRLVPGVDFASGVLAVTAGAHHTCAVTAAEALACWGYNRSGQIGDGSTVSRRVPVRVPGLEANVVAVSAGSYSTCALLRSGGVRCWGSNNFGQLGDGGATDRYAPAPVRRLGGFAVALASGLAHTCALLSPTRVLRCWGYNNYGELGDGTTTTRLLPVPVASFRGLLRGRARLARRLAAGVHPLQASYPGDADHAPSTSAVVRHRVK